MNKRLIDTYILSSISTIKKLKTYDYGKILEASKLIYDCVSKKHKLLICGNGGSAADAQHFAAELVGRFQKNRVALPALALNTDTAALTAISNDYGYDEVFSRQVSGLGNKGDLLFVISTSGKSKNIIKAAETAKNKKIKIIALTGNKKSKLDKLSNIIIKAPSSETAHIQEVHAILIHIICLLLEKRF